MPLSTPAGTLTVSVRRARTRPSPLHSPHGCSMTEPRPPQRGQARVVMTWPRNERATRCTVIVDGTSDGRVEFARAAAAIPADVAIDERSIDDALYAPADAEPDLILVLGPHARLPPSLVWELAYAELVYSDAAFGDLGPAATLRPVPVPVWRWGPG